MAVKHDLVRRHAVVEPSCSLLEGLLEAGVGERLHLPARVTNEVMVMVAARVGGLIASDAVADVDALYEAPVGELVDGAVDACDPDSATVRANAVEDLLGGEAAVLLAEMLHHGRAGAAFAQSCFVQARKRLLCPCCVSCRHALMIPTLKDVLACLRDFKNRSHQHRGDSSKLDDNSV